MLIDPRTIVIINILSAGLFGIALLAVSKGYLRQIKGISDWATASLLNSFSWLLFAMRDKAPDFVTIILALGFFQASLAYYFKIVADFTGRSKNTRWVIYLISVSTLALAYFLYVQPDTGMRVVVISIATAVLLFASAYVLLSGRERRPKSHLFTGVVFAFSGVFAVFRGLYYLFWDPSHNIDMFSPDIMQTITFLTTYLTSAIVTFGFLLMSYDLYITQHETAEEEIKLNEERLNEAQKLAKVGSWEFDLDTGTLTWSKEHYHIFEMEDTPAEKLYEECRKHIHPDDLPQLDEAIRIGREQNRGVIYEHRIICKDGSIKYLLGIGEIYKGVNGNRNMLRGTVQDVTELKKAEETARKFAILESKSKEMEQFAYIASHDLREPLLTIKNYVELFSDEYKEKLDEESAEYLHRISRAAIRMDELMRGLLDYSRLSKIKELQQVDCNETVAQVLADLDSLINNTKAHIVIDPLPVLKAYPLEMKQLFQNLLTNAIKFRKSDVIPEIRISAQKVNGIWTFKVTDNGIGIRQVDTEKIFALFQRLHNRNEYAGSGIGLAYCKKIVELHHGSIWVESTPGAGSSFYFTIIT